MTSTSGRDRELLREHLGVLHRRTDRMFGVLFVLQFIAGILAAAFISPRTWAGPVSETHVHLWAAVLLGGCLVSMPLALIVVMPGKAVTRYTIAVAQMMFSALLIHLTGGRIETHFHVFGSLAFLAFYRDWRVLVPATAVVAADHLLRGIYWPESVFGVIASAPWRALEHAGWVLFEDVFLAYSCVQGMKEMGAIASAQARIERARDETEEEVRLRTHELELKTAELHASEERYALAMEGSQDGLWDWDLVANRMYYAPRWAQLLGLRADQVTDSPDEWFGRIASGNLSRFHADLTAHIEGRTDRLELELEMNHATGETRWMLCRAAAIRDAHGKATRLAGSLTDISELKNAQEELRRIAQHDRLTELPNRSYFKERLRDVIAQSRTETGKRFAVLFFDFDQFKLINDSLGHPTGDALLISIANRFRRVLRAHDVAARFGGDEFVVLLDQLNSADEARATCDRMLYEFSQPHEIDGRSVVSTASIGLVLSDLGYDDAEEMIRDADVAMYQAKVAGRGSYREFDATMHAQAVDRLNLEQDLRRPEIYEQLFILYQPIVALDTGRISGFEALLRWRHPTQGVISPDVFIPAAEETGVIVPIGDWVFREACGQIARWRRDSGLEDLTVSVNLSRRQIISQGLADRLATIVDECGIDPSSVRLEITESDVMDDRYDATSSLERIREHGFRFAMDDFGTGHSSLWCLHRFPIDVLKIDRSFVRNMEVRREFTAVMQAIVALSHNLGLKVVAEGVETHDQLAQLQAMDCEFAQGYLFSRPLEVCDVAEILHDRFGRRAA